jgi:hypothetical protein
MVMPRIRWSVNIVTTSEEPPPGTPCSYVCITSSEQRPQPQKSVTLRPQPGGGPQSLLGHVALGEKNLKSRMYADVQAGHA